MTVEPVAMKQMPQYQCHKKVWALKINSFDRNDDGTAKIGFADEGFAAITVDAEWLLRFKGTGGDLGYYVVYDDGYKSWSPSVPFQEGYTLID